jgi:ADP-ribose pyrophosphatase YjhB (NUDIX family)
MKLYDQIRDFQPWNEQEQRDRELILRWLDSGAELLTRENPVAHLTASSWVVSPDRKSVLMAYHNLYDSWAWLGGHADGEADLQAVAAREAREESGIRELTPLTDGPISLEVLTVDGHEKRGAYVSSHLHLNVTYFAVASMDEEIRPKPDENSGVTWMPLKRVLAASTEPWIRERVYRKLIVKTFLAAHERGLPR